MKLEKEIWMIDNTTKKNILFILPDQLRADFLSCYGADFLQTPNIDSICEDGLRFERCLSPHPLCVPARAAMMTGRNAIRNGVMFNDCWLRPDHSECGVDTWPQKLAASGYHTEAIGKMHFYPWDASEGFTHRIIAEDKRFTYIQDDYSEYLQSKGLKRLHGVEQSGYTENKGASQGVEFDDQIDNWVGGKACEFIETYDSDKPFALMVGFPGPHCPYDPPTGFADEFDEADMPASIPATDDSRVFKDFFVKGFKGEWCQLDYSDFPEDCKRRLRSHYCALIKMIDNQIGNMISSLKKRDMLKDTVIIFASDHGDLLGDYDLMGKHYFYETSIRVPLLIKHPSCSGSQTVDSLVSLTDITSTILTLAGLEAVPGCDSIRLCDDRGNATAGREYVFGCSDLGFMIADDQWKLCRYRNGSTHLFNLKQDPAEQDNLALNPVFARQKERLDALLQKELALSIVDANLDKVVPEFTGLGRGDFGMRDWKRVYPNSKKY
jgi:arylsulfatase A-like enzyme